MQQNIDYDILWVVEMFQFTPLPWVSDAMW